MSEYSVSPWTTVDADPDDPRFDALLDALAGDRRALGAGGISTSLSGPVTTIFQVESDTLPEASALAVDVFDRALEQAGFDERTAGIAAVEGSDPELLP